MTDSCLQLNLVSTEGIKEIDSKFPRMLQQVYIREGAVVNNPLLSPAQIIGMLRLSLHRKQLQPKLCKEVI